MDIGEAFTMALITDNHDESCYFCSADKKPEDMVNGLIDEYDEDSDIDGVGFKNDSGKLAGNLGGPPGDRQITISTGQKPSSTAAHHLIPGNASLKPSKLMTENWLWKDGMAKGNIGYDVNSRPNGEWLPGNYAVRPWGPLNDGFKQTYAFTAIQVWGRQFHDAHPDYSNEVKDALDKIALKLKLGQDVWCEEGQKKKEESPEERNPLYTLVARLHTLSGRLKRFLVQPESNWNVRLYTSRFSLLYVMSMNAMDED
jgi:hypothetical protein